MPIIPPRIEAYLSDISSPEPELLYRLNRETHQKVLYPRMLSGQVQGRFLAMIAQLMHPQHILEVGTYTGYSALCFGEGLPPQGRITTIELNPEKGWLIRKYLEQAGLAEQVELILGRAAEVLPDLRGPFDLVFLDADKANYPQYFEVIVPKMSQGGLLIADNVLWDGKVVDPAAQDKETEGIRRFNRLVRDDKRMEQVLLPLRDGMLLARKR
jgi:caffeoyl-CoA O-methyltransferase